MKNHSSENNSRPIYEVDGSNHFSFSSHYHHSENSISHSESVSLKPQFQKKGTKDETPIRREDLYKLFVVYNKGLSCIFEFLVILTNIIFLLNQNHIFQQYEERITALEEKLNLVQSTTQTQISLQTQNIRKDLLQLSAQLQKAQRQYYNAIPISGLIL